MIPHSHAPRSVRLAAALILCAGAAASAQTQTQTQSPNQPNPMTTALRWSSGATTTVVPMSPSQLAQRTVQLAARPDQTRVLVHLAHPPSPADRAQLTRDGLTLTTALGGTSYFATLDHDADTNAISRAPVVSIDAISRQHKLHTDLLAGILRPWMYNPEEIDKNPQLAAKARSGIITIDEFALQHIDPTVVVVVMLHADADRAAQRTRLTKAYNAQVVSEVKALNAMTMLVKASALDAIADDDAVMWVEPPLPQLSINNAENRALTGVNTVNAPPYALDGTGVTVMVYDAGKVYAHQDFGSRLTIGASDTSSVNYHSTHVAGTIGGDGTGNYNYRGMAPGVNLVSYAFEVPGGLEPGFLYTDPGDLEADYSEAIALYGVDLANNSIGSNVESNGYNCAWQGDYGTTSALIDAIVRGSTGSPFRVLWAAGNERQGSRCNVEGFGSFYSVAPPSTAKNHITVGSVDSDTDLNSSFSSWGPTDDGRLKPDISAPGCQLGGDGGVTSTNSGGGYTTLCGTSMATPTAAGISALILEQYRITFPDRSEPMNATLKALLANTAVDRGNPGPDFAYGYGSIRATNAVDAVIAQNIAESQVSQGATYRAVVIVEPGTPELKVTMAWDDAPAVPNVSSVLVNDLDLRLTDASGNVYLPWTLNPSSPNANAVRTVRDGKNNIEQVAITNPAPGAYTVEITGFNIAQGAQQTFGVVSSSTLINCSSAGIVSMGAGILPCSGSTTVRVIDCDLNTSDDFIDSVTVLIDSDSQPTPLMLTLTETAAESAAFTASFTFSSSGQADLLVSEGDTISATYLDFDDGQGNTNVTLTAQATIDCTPPEINSVEIGQVMPRSAKVFVSLDEEATATVHYGTNPNALNQSVSSPGYSTSHAIDLINLTDETTYYVAVEAQDRAGNSVEDNNNGAGYTFTTPDIPDFFTEVFTSGLDLEGLSLILTPSAGPDGYVANTMPLDNGVLPFEPTAGTSLFLYDDDSKFVSLTGGKQVVLYGQSYSGLYIGSNGYITLGASDSDWSESLGDHFDLPRISALFDDLNPSSGGTVYRQQLSDRMVVSYNHVTEYGSGNDNTFQVELHFDGTIVISWERIDSGDAIVGISAGNGLDNDFQPSDLSAYPAINTCVPDLNGDGQLDFFDLSDFINAFSAQDPRVDFNNDGAFDFFDVSLFINAFSAGCP